MLSQMDKYPVLASISECTGCLACVESCTQGALMHYMGDDGHVYVSINRNKCVGCKACERVCISSRNNYGNNDLSKSKIYAAWSSDIQQRNKATSGGVFAAVAKYVLDNGGVVVGAYLDGRECRHIMITKSDEIEKLQGSKYMFSSMSGIYKVIEKEICNGLVLFSGAGCQCAGVIAYFEHNKYKNNLITMDLVCGGAPSHILLDKFYQSNPSVEKIVSFRSKDKYELKVLQNGEIKNVVGKSLPLHGFNCEMTNRLKCYDCQFACAHRRTDMTIGDLWNYNYMIEEHQKGLSTVIVHTEKGNTILKSADITLNSLKWSQCIKYCKRIVWGHSHIFYPRKKLVSNAKTMEEAEFKKLYCIAMKPSDLKMTIFRIYRFILMRINDFKVKQYIGLLLRKYER